MHIHYTSIDAVVTIALSSCNTNSSSAGPVEHCSYVRNSPCSIQPTSPPEDGIHLTLNLPQSLARLSVSVSSRTFGVPRPCLSLSLVQVPILRLVLVSFNVQSCERSHLMSRTETFLSSVLMPPKNALFGQINLFIDTNAE